MFSVNIILEDFTFLVLALCIVWIFHISLINRKQFNSRAPEILLNICCIACVFIWQYRDTCLYCSDSFAPKAPGYFGSDQCVWHVHMKEPWTGNWMIHVPYDNVRSIWPISTSAHSFVKGVLDWGKKKQITSNYNDLVLILRYLFV